MGVDPGPRTLGELLAMAEARSRERWQHTSTILAMLANLHRDPRRSRAFRPADFDPFAAEPQPAKVGIEVLREVFVDRRL